MNLSPVEISNFALDELPSANIVIWSEASAQAEYARKHYGVCLAELLEATDWGFARVRLPLAQAAANDRLGEFQFAYAIPNDVALLIRLLPPYNDGGTGAYVLQVGQAMAYPLVNHDVPGLPYDWAGTTLYSDQEGAVLEYIQVGPSTTTLTASAQFTRALVLLLASRLAMPITKDSTKRRELMGMAELAKQRAMAASLNSRPNSYGNHMPDSISARLGIAPGVDPAQIIAGWGLVL